MRLAEVHQHLRTELDHTKPFAAIWDTTGYRPGELVDALNRRANHLTHHALTNHEPWIDETIRQWTHHHPDGDDHHTLHELQHLIHDIAAHRERTSHTGPDPLGPAPKRQYHHHTEWTRLRAAITEPIGPDLYHHLGH